MLNLEKCEFLQDTISFLWHKVHSGGVELLAAHVDTIINCWKCIMRDDHHEFECKLYNRILKRICRNCNAGYHYDSECIGRKDSRTNVKAVTLAETLALDYQKN